MYLHTPSMQTPCRHRSFQGPTSVVGADRQFDARTSARGSSSGEDRRDRLDLRSRTLYSEAFSRRNQQPRNADTGLVLVGRAVDTQGNTRAQQHCVLCLGFCASQNPRLTRRSVELEHRHAHRRVAELQRELRPCTDLCAPCPLQPHELCVIGGQGS